MPADSARSSRCPLPMFDISASSHRGRRKRRGPISGQRETSFGHGPARIHRSAAASRTRAHHCDVTRLAGTYACLPLPSGVAATRRARPREIKGGCTRERERERKRGGYDTLAASTPSLLLFPSRTRDTRLHTYASFVGAHTHTHTPFASLHARADIESQLELVNSAGSRARGRSSASLCVTSPTRSARASAF